MVFKSGSPNDRSRSTVKREEDDTTERQRQEQAAGRPAQSGDPTVDASSVEEGHQPTSKELHFSQPLFEDDQQPIPSGQGPPNKDSDEEFDEGGLLTQLIGPSIRHCQERRPLQQSTETKLSRWS